MASPNAPLYVRVAGMRQESQTVRSYELVALDGQALPAFTAGAHVGIVMPGRITRYYSLCSSPHARHHYRIGVQHEPEGRGGSALVHALVRPGRMLKLHRPRNLFPLADSGRHILLGGGIGITPMLSMAAELEHRGQDYQLLYCVRDATQQGFAQELQALAARGRARVFHTAQGRPDLSAWLGTPAPDVHVYTCGSAGFMQHVAALTAHWPAAQVHSESFTPIVAQAGDIAFVVEARRSGKTFNVEADQSLLQALQRNGIDVDSVCENGSCGTCKVPYCAGTPEHRDMVLGAKERQHYLMACVSRSRDFLALDL